MGTFFTRERFGKPQLLAAGLLVIFLGQCVWLVTRTATPSEVDTSDLFRAQEGLRQWRGLAIAGQPSDGRTESLTALPIEIEDNEGYDPNHSPLWYLLASLPLTGPEWWQARAVPYWGWLMRVPNIVFGLLLGASLWYVSHRLYGYAGGYIALALYCFSPVILSNCALAALRPEMGAAWGAFGAVFTAIAVAHTLYAPREVVLWNSRRILLLGLALALAVGSQFSLIVVVLVSLVLLLYVAHCRRGAALAIWLAACVVGAVLFCGAYAFVPLAIRQGVRHAHFFGTTWQSFTMPRAYLGALASIVKSGPAVPIMLVTALATYAVWPRVRYFGNTAPLLIAGLFLALGMSMPHYPGLGFQLMALPFAFIFVAGVAADLIDTGQGTVVTACVWGLLAADGLWNLVQLARIGKG
ncbi:MAG TPA: hypothetical protein VF753_00395 [Terriglobales bacterium]